MHVDPAESSAPQSSILNEAHHFAIRRGLSGREHREISQNRFTIAQVAACKLACHERMHNHSTFHQEISETRLPGAQMSNPD